MGIFCVGAAVLRATTVSAPSDAAAASPRLREEAFRWITTAEPEMRATAMEHFPADDWSRSDDFHASERAKAHEFATSRGVSRAEVWRAFDDGLRERWPLPPGVILEATVPPCRPRPLY